MNLRLKLFLTIGMFASLTAVHAASFDCAKASSPTEKMICQNPNISKLDDRLSAAYKEAKKTNPSIVEEQRAWLKKTRECKDEQCLESLYVTRVQELEGGSKNINQPQASSSAAATPAASEIRKPSTPDNELGNQNFVTEPKAAPVLVSKGTRYWPCNGMVSNQLIDIIYDEIAITTKAEGVAPPQKGLCYWKRGVFNFGGNSIQTYAVQFYLDQNSFNSCARLDNCQEIRTVYFKVVNNQLVREYLITSAPRRLTRSACVSMKGEVINLKSGC